MKVKAGIFAVLFIVIISYGAEYMVNRNESDFVFGLFIVLAAALFYILIYKPIKQLFK